MPAYAVVDGALGSGDGEHAISGAPMHSDGKAALDGFSGRGELLMGLPGHATQDDGAVEGAGGKQHRGAMPFVEAGRAIAFGPACLRL